MARAWGCLFGLILRMSLLDKRLDVTSVIAVPFKIVLQKGLIVDFEKSPGLGLFGVRAGKQQRFCFLGSILGRWLPGRLPVDGKNELRLFF